MADDLTAQISLSAVSLLTKDFDLVDIPSRVEALYELALALGTGANQINLRFHDQRTLTATSEDLDLVGALKDEWGRTLTFTKIKLLYIRNRATGAGEVLTIGNGTHPIVSLTGAAAHTYKVGPEGVDIKVNPDDGFAVGAEGVADDLGIDSGAATIIYDIIILGVGTTTGP